MELWIRSQDKEKLVKCNDIAIRRFVDEDTLYSYQVLGYFDKEAEFEILGIYETKKRSLEVLDEIQEKLTIRKVNETSGIEYILCQDLVPIIYEMPKE